MQVADVAVAMNGEVVAPSHASTGVRYEEDAVLIRSLQDCKCVCVGGWVAALPVAVVCSV